MRGIDDRRLPRAAAATLMLAATVLGAARGGSAQQAPTSAPPSPRNDVSATTTKTAVGSAAGATETRAETARPNPERPRRYTTGVTIQGQPAIQFELASPRIPAAELEKVLASPAILDRLNDQHLADLGEAEVARPCRVGPVFLDPGRYQVGLTLGAARSIALRIASPGGASEIPLEVSANAAAVPVITLAMLPADDLEAFALEVRVGALRGVVPIDFDARRIIVSLNNTAHELLNPADAEQRIAPRDVALALQLAGRANDMTRRSNPEILDTYALALFHAGQIDDAISTQREALRRLDPSESTEAQRGGMVARLRAYQLAKAK